MCLGDPRKAVIVDQGQTDQFAGHTSKMVENRLHQIDDAEVSEEVRSGGHNFRSEFVSAAIAILPDIAEPEQFGE